MLLEDRSAFVIELARQDVVGHLDDRHMKPLAPHPQGGLQTQEPTAEDHHGVLDGLPDLLGIDEGPQRTRPVGDGEDVQHPRPAPGGDDELVVRVGGAAAEDELPRSVDSRHRALHQIRRVALGDQFGERLLVTECLRQHDA